MRTKNPIWFPSTTQSFQLKITTVAASQKVAWICANAHCPLQLPTHIHASNAHGLPGSPMATHFRHVLNQTCCRMPKRRQLHAKIDKDSPRWHKSLQQEPRRHQNIAAMVLLQFLCGSLPYLKIIQDSSSSRFLMTM